MPRFGAAGSTLREVLNHRKSVRFEWIVIAIIAIKVVNSVRKEMVPLL